MTAGLPLMTSVLTQLAQSVLIPSGLSAGMSAADAAIQKKSFTGYYSIKNFKRRNGK